MHDEQGMRRMGALRKAMPITAATFIVGWLAIAGVPPFAGFWSKDEILLYAYDASPALWALGLLTALLTAFYMARQVFLVFFGEPRSEEHTSELQSLMSISYAVFCLKKKTHLRTEYSTFKLPQPIPTSYQV